jgi:hypothetical protein
LIAAEQATASYKVRILLKRDDDNLARVSVDRIEFDERDADLNLVVGDNSATGVSDFLTLLSDTSRYSDNTPLFVRHYVDPAIQRPHFNISHRDTPIYTYATEPQTETVGLLEWFDGVEDLLEKN